MNSITSIALPLADEALDGVPATKVRGYWQSVLRRLGRDKITLAFGAVVLAILLVAVFAPLIAPFDPYAQSVIGRLKPFGWRGHPWGTDELGRDMMSRLIYGGRISLLMGMAPVLVAVIVGGSLGVIGGFAGKLANTVIMRTMDVFYAFPSILLAVAISGAMGGGILNGILSLSLVFIPAMCRVAETATAQVKNLDYIEAARASGAGTLAIVRHHVLGNVLGPVFIYASSLVSVSILLASGLSFLGLGVQPPEPDWGLMLSTLRQSLYVDPIGCTLPGGRDLRHLDLLQPGQRRGALGDGREGVMSGDLAALFSPCGRGWGRGPHRRSAPCP